MSNWKPGMPSPNPQGRPKGIIDKRMRLNKALMENADGLLAVATAKAFEGDPHMLNLLLSRVMPALRPQNDDRVQFQFDATKPVADQLLQVASAVASGDLSLEQGKQFAEILQRIAAVRALTHEGDHQAELIQAMRDMAQRMPV